MEVKGKIAIVNGASSGIGRALALELAKSGATVAACARRRDRLEELLKEIGARSPESMCRGCDCTQEEQVKETVRCVHDRYGRIDIMLNIAGLYHPKFVRDSVWQDYYRDLDVGFLGAVRFNQEVLPIMIKQKRGIILNMSSIIEHMRPLGLSAYAATKAAVRGYSDVLHKEVKGYGIHVGVIEPVLVESEMTLTGRPPKSLKEIGEQIVRGSLENYVDFNAHIHMQTPEASAREIIREGIERERFEVYTGEPQIWTVYGMLMKMLPGLSRGIFSVMSATMAAAETSPAGSKRPRRASEPGTEKKTRDPAKAMNALFAFSRPAARITKELYVRLDEGLNRSIYNLGKRFFLRLYSD